MTDSASTTRPSYKDTLNLPKTDFPMKANLAQQEPVSLKRWSEMKLYEKALDERDGAERYVFHDGPPYTSGNIHVGHLLNKVLKDIVVRSRLMMGKSCPYVPGWDCHGLPIEHRVMQELIAAGKADKLATLTEDQRRMAVRRECRKYAEKYMKLQVGQMQRLLTLADYEHPYFTMDAAYEQKVLEVFADLLERGLVYRALKSVHWSIANETALAEAELEYYDREDPSIYVDFEAAEKDAVAKAFGLNELDETPSFMIWTTTPWTLPANLAIAVHPKHRYVLVRMDGGLTIVAKELLERVTKAVKAEQVEVVGETGGDALVGLRYRHPMIGGTASQSVRVTPTPELRVRATTEVHRIVAAEYVTLEDGTGLVHTAPGHGEDDYQTGLREGLPIYCPVMKDGRYDDTVPDWLRGMLIWDANPKIIEHLSRSGHLVHTEKFTHSYPHDWRGKSPVIFRATDQWFVSVDKEFLPPPQRAGGSLRSRALRAVEHDVRFIPEWGRNRMRGMLDSRPDWCLSRQRAWGLPIPAFQNEAGEVFMTPGSVRAVAKVIGAKGSDAWFTESVDALLGQYEVKSDPDAPAWMKAHGLESAGFGAQLTKMYDIFDVWFESGSSWNAVLRARDIGYPADLYLEGSDQHRGWFQLSMLPALGVTGQPPFRTLLTHGFVVDKDGRKMSKSLGNALEVEDLLKDFGADVCRWWVSSLPFENDIKVDLEFFKTMGESYRKVRNTLRFLLSNLSDFDPTSGGTGFQTRALDAAPLEPASLDAWALATTAKLQHDVARAYGDFEFRAAHQALYDFCNDSMSALYLAAVKDRLYCDRADSPRRRQTQMVLRTISETLCRLLAPVLPHTADEAFRSLHAKDGDGASSVHLMTFFDLDFTSDADWAKVLEARERAQKALEEAKELGVENPLDAEIIAPDADGLLSPFAADFADICGVSRARFDRSAKDVVINDLRNEPKCERCWKRTADTKGRSDGGTLCDRCAEAVNVR
jgi:isoleucyl-tRNA synthetase